MAYVVSRPGGRWELREARSTPRGPRSRTLVSFRELTPELVERAVARSRTSLTSAEARGVARRAGAPVPSTRADEAAATLIRELGAGRPPRRGLARALTASLGQARADLAPPLRAASSSPSRDETAAISDNARAGATWAGATPAQRGSALRDLLLLGDRLPHSARPDRPRFPRLDALAA